MNKKQLFVWASPVLIIFLLACSTLTGGGGVGENEAGGEENEIEIIKEPIRQWASTASASSEYGSESWSAKQATGAPNTTECADSVDAWASLTYADGIEWLEVGYDTPVAPTQINIYETYYPGQVVTVEVRDESGNLQTVWQGEAHVESQCPRVFTVDVAGIDYKVTAVRVSLDQSAANYWGEVDAIELVGTP